MAGFSDTKDGPQRSYIDIAGSEAAETVEVELRPGRPSPVGAEASGGTAQVLGGGGDDTITLVATGTAGQAGVDTGYWLAANVGGGSGDDRISFTGGIATSIKVYGDAGNDTLIGTGADRVDGGAGDDVIEARQTRIVVGGTGNDRITVGQGTLVQMVRDNGTDVVEFDASALASGGRGDAGLTIWVQDLLSNIDEFESRIAVRRDGADFVLTAWDGGSIRIKDAAEAAWSVGIDAGIIGGQRAGARIVAADTPSGARLSFSV
jgi:Ca2+-binding RTX toxin-like protein